MKKVLIVYGTRPEAIKMAPLIRILKTDQRFELRVCSTGQHKEMLSQVHTFFKIKPDFDLGIMDSANNINDIVALCLTGIQKIIENFAPDIILVHGDTSSSLAGALAGFNNKIKVCHVEAGLRTNDLWSPWPEEGNRKLITAICTRHYAPTQTSYDNLLNEGISKSNILITGNTVIDALFFAVEKVRKKSFISFFDGVINLDKNKKMILVTAHRRENLGGNLENICDALNAVTEQMKNIQIIFPVHLNPSVQSVVRQKLGKNKNIFLIGPQSYQAFIKLMDAAHLILTDSGGIQEEAPSLNKPVFVLRDTTERPEAIESGTIKLIGTNAEVVIAETKRILQEEKLYQDMANAKNPFGDGQASKRIANDLNTIGSLNG